MISHNTKTSSSSSKPFLYSNSISKIKKYIPIKHKIKDINKETYDLGANNPNRKEEVDNRTPEQILAEIEKLDIEVLKAIQSIKELL